MKWAPCVALVILLTLATIAESAKIKTKLQGDVSKRRGIAHAKANRHHHQQNPYYPQDDVPYDVNAEDLLQAVESQRSSSAMNDDYYPDSLSDKTFDQLGGGGGGSFGGLLPGGGGAITGEGADGESVTQNPEQQMIVRAALPVAVAGFLALALSSVFANQFNVNATSNASLPLLWKLPYVDDPRNDQNPYRNRRAVGEGEVEDHRFPAVWAEYAGRLKDGMVLYSLMENDEGCREKIACIFAQQTRGTGRMEELVPQLMRSFLPERFQGFSGHFLRALEGDGKQDCAAMQCNKCFSV